MSFFAFKEKDGTINIQASGYITHEPKVFDKIVLFSVCYGKDKYYDCKAWRNDASGRIAECLEKHDEVVVFGVYDVYEPDGGEKKERIAVDAILPVSPTSAPAAKAPTGASKNDDSPFTDLNEDDSDLPF